MFSKDSCMWMWRCSYCASGFNIVSSSSSNVYVSITSQWSTAAVGLTKLACKKELLLNPGDLNTP